MSYVIGEASKKEDILKIIKEELKQEAIYNLYRARCSNPLGNYQNYLMDYNDERFEKITEAEVLKAIRTVEKDKQNGLIVG